MSSQSDSECSSSTQESSEDNSTAKKPETYDVLSELWPEESRPKGLKSRAQVNACTPDALFGFMKFAEFKAKKNRGENLESGTKDQKPKTIRFRGAKDNSRDQLHEARWLRQPITDPKVWYKEVPVKRERVYRNLNFEYYGTENCLNEKSIAALHDRTLVLELKHFASINASTNKPVKEFRQTNEHGTSTFHDIIWDQPRSLLAIQEAINNYAMALHAIWPSDMTAIILTRVLIKYHWIAAAKSEKTRMNCINAFFNDVMRGNVRRATNGKAVLDFDAQEKCLKAALIRFEVPTDVPISSRSDPSPNWQSQQQKGPQKSGQTRQPPRKRNEARFNNNPLCFAFNDKGRKCSNQSTATGCSPRPGINFAHVCSKWVASKKDFCYGSHAEENHR